MKLKVILFLISLYTSSAFAGGADYNPFSGSKTLALNGMYYAGSDNAFSFNPASLTDLDGFRINFSIVDKIGQQEFVNPVSGLHRSYSEDKFNYSLGLSWKPGKIAFGLTYNPVVDYYVSWPYAILRQRNNSTVVKAFDVLNSTQINSVSPSAAYDFGSIKIGVSANIYLMNFKTDFAQSSERWLSGAGEPGYQFRYKEDGIGYGATAGATFLINEDISFAAVISTPFSIDLSGTGTSAMLAELDSAASEVDLGGKFEMPMKAGAGFLYNISEIFSLNADISYSFWGSTQKELDYGIENSVWRSRLTSTDPLTGINAQVISLNMENSFSAGIGAEFFPGVSMYFRAGYRYTQSPYSNGTYNMLFNAVDTHNFSLGMGYFEGSYSIDLTVLYSAGISNNIDNQAFTVNSGTYDSKTIVPALTLTYKL